MNQFVPRGNHALVGESPLIQRVRRLIEKLSRNRLPVLLSGETGTGKENVARAMHNANGRGQFVTIDCCSLVVTLMESEHFGHIRGSFTNATEHKKGLVEAADGGTVFFDEIGDLPIEMQVKLLRLIQEGEFRAVGSTTWRKVDLRIIAATHRDLKAEVAAGRFRLDLFYRLNVFSIRLPTLRDRMEDIPVLVDHFLQLAEFANFPDFHPSGELMAALNSYNWPGNIRELKHCIERLAVMNSEGALQLADLPTPFQNHLANLNLQRLSDAIDPPGSPRQPALSGFSEEPNLSIQQSERQAIGAALEAAEGQRGRAAELLNMSRTTLYRRMKQYGME